MVLWFVHVSWLNELIFRKLYADNKFILRSYRDNLDSINKSNHTWRVQRPTYYIYCYWNIFQGGEFRSFKFRECSSFSKWERRTSMEFSALGLRNKSVLQILMAATFYIHILCSDLIQEIQEFRNATFQPQHLNVPLILYFSWNFDLQHLPIDPVHNLKSQNLFCYYECSHFLCPCRGSTSSHMLNNSNRYNMSCSLAGGC